MDQFRIRMPEALQVLLDVVRQSCLVRADGDSDLDGILKVLDHDINRLGVVLDEMAAIAGDSVKVTVTVSADEAALPHDVKKYL